MVKKRFAFSPLPLDTRDDNELSRSKLRAIKNSEYGIHGSEEKEIREGEFDLGFDDDAAWSVWETLLHRGVEAAGDGGDFLFTTLKTAREAGLARLYRAFVTKPERRHRVHTLILFTAPVFPSLQRNF